MIKPNYFISFYKNLNEQNEELTSKNVSQNIMSDTTQGEDVVEETHKKKIFVLVGPPSVGKTTWVANMFVTEPYIIDRDSVVESVAEEYGWTYDDMFVNPPVDAAIGEYDEKYGEVVAAPNWMPWTKTVFSKVLKANGKVHHKFMEKVAGASKSGQDIVVDMTNMNSGARKQALSAVADEDYEKIAVVFEFEGAEDIIKKVAEKRAAAAKRMGKSKTIPSHVLDKMFGAFSRPQASEGFDQIVSVDNREMLKKLANEPLGESKMVFQKTRWQKLAGILSESVGTDVIQQKASLLRKNMVSLSPRAWNQVLADLENMRDGAEVAPGLAKHYEGWHAEDFEHLLSLLPGEKDVEEVDIEDYDDATSKIKLL